jgi:hypothetical protein
MFSEKDFEHVIAVENGEIVCSQDVVERIAAECDLIAAGPDRYAANYSFSRLELTKHKAFDVLLYKGEIAGWCGLFNGGRYPEGVFRIMNRLYLNPKYRGSFFRPYTRKLYFDQVRRHRADIRMLFLSRNHLKGKFHVRRWAKYGAGEEGWTVSDGLVKVAPAENQLCYQYISYRKYAPVDWPERQISEADWRRLPEH